MGFIILTVLFLVYSAVYANEYYWRDYVLNYHQIPSDAFVAGQTINLENIYVGQTNIWPHVGVHPVAVSAGKEIWAAHDGPQRATNFIQILCSEHTNNFKWVPATSQNLHLVGINTHIVRGGLDYNHLTYIGRANHQGNIVIGKVFTHDTDNSDMVYVFNNIVYVAKSYEILTYD